ncbi:MAG: FkbM family methyltransferase [Pseudomonadota bacterium]|nr:FkbM family methyltransferase [Pseudomonadota bacterium]
MRKNKKIYQGVRSVTNLGILSFFEKIVRSHPLSYFIIRKLIRFTNIFEEDAKGVKILKFNKNINLMDIGASDGIAAKFFAKNLRTNKIICFEPDKNYLKILNNLPINNLIVKPYAIGDKDNEVNVYYPEYQIFGKKYKFVTYCFYDKKILEKQIYLDFKFRKNIRIIKEKIKIRKLEKINLKIHLIKIDVNGFELSVLRGLNKIIKKDKPALILETGKDDKKIRDFLSKYSYKQFIYMNESKTFEPVKDRYSLNTYFLQKKHF